MVDKQVKTPIPKNGPKGKSGDKAADSSPESAAVDRPGFDLGGSTGKTSAGTGVGLGADASEESRDRSLPGRRGKRT